MFEGVVEVVFPQAVTVPGVRSSHRQVERLGPVPVSPGLPLHLLPAGDLSGRQLFPLLESSKKFQSHLSQIHHKVDISVSTER